MKFAYKFSNLLGTIYKKGNIIFTPNGNSVISPVGNKITVYDLKSNKAHTLAFESKFNYTSIDISPNGCLLVAVNEKGAAQMISLVSNTVVHTYKFSSAAHCVKFSPDGTYFAISKENMVFVFRTPGEITGEYNSFVLRRYFFGAHDHVVWIDWSCDSKVLVVGSRDNSIKVYAIEMYENFRPYLLGGHTDSIVGCFFDANSLDVNTISRNGQVSYVELVVRSLPDTYAERALQYIAKYLNISHHIEFYLNWACSILTFHGPKENILSHQSLLTLHQSLNRKYELLSKVCYFNKYTMKVLTQMSNDVPDTVGENDEDENDDENLILIRSNNEIDHTDDEEMNESSSTDESED